MVMASLGKMLGDPVSVNKLDVVTHACHPNYSGSLNRISVQASLSKNYRPFRKITKAKGVGGMA
jgi:hypothetical protein